MGHGGGGRKMRSVSTQRSGLAWLYEALVSIFKDVALSPPSHFLSPQRPVLISSLSTWLLLIYLISCECGCAPQGLGA